MGVLKLLEVDISLVLGDFLLLIVSNQCSKISLQAQNLMLEDSERNKGDG
jgi:hypothetical protein